MRNIGWPEIVIVGIIVLLVFGASQIPKIARAVGEGLKELKKGIKEAKTAEDEAVGERDAPTRPRRTGVPRGRRKNKKEAASGRPKKSVRRKEKTE